ncbi:MAG TPA: ATP-binding protein [Polyangiaceae bacterium]
MDDTTFESLRSALAAGPDNPKLLLVVLSEALARNEAAMVLELLDYPAVHACSDPADRRLLAQGFRAVGKRERALELVGDDTPESLLERSKVLLELDRKDDAKRAYDQAVSANPALEDLALKGVLGAQVREVQRGEGRPALRVISNDDTAQTEINRLIAPPEATIKFDDVGGLGEIKKQITRKIILPYKKPSLFQRFRRRTGGGILMYGPPGCGKTLLARATAGECDAQFFAVAISDVLDMYIGESERKLHALFEKARSSAPAILFFDELEALAGRRQYAREGTSSKLVSQFLAEMDGFAQNNGGVLILGATNVPWAVDGAFRRPGRFDRMLFVPPPDQPAREQILEGLLRDRPVAPEVSAEFIAKNTSGFSGADLKNLVETAVDEAIEESLERGRESPVTKEHLLRALKDVKPTTLEWLTTARNHARYSNEAGHYDDVLAFLKKHGKA